MIKIIQRKVLIYFDRSVLDVGKIKCQNLRHDIYEKTFRNLGSGFINCYFVTVKNIKKML